jgi:hypothetical protein
MMSSAMTNPVLTAFGLQDQEAPLCRAFRATGAVIHGGAAVSWYLKTDPPPGQDIDIWCQPAEAILKPILFALYDTIFRAAGYQPQVQKPREKREYVYDMRNAHIDAIHNWFHPLLKRKIQLIFRKSHTKDGAPVPTSPTGEFDIDITAVRVAPSLLGDRLISYLPSPELGKQIDRRVLNIHNLKGQNLRKVQIRIRKYYERGFAFESTEARCSCACGATHHVVVTPPHRLLLKEAMVHVRKSWIAANPLSRWNRYRADNVKKYFLTSFSEKRFVTQSVAEISEALDICDRALSLPQNRFTLPVEVHWISNFRNILFAAWRVRNLENMATELEEGVPKASFCNDVIRRATSILGQPELEGFPEMAVKVRAIQRRAVEVWGLQQAVTETPVPHPIKKAAPSLTVTETNDTADAISYA